MEYFAMGFYGAIGVLTAYVGIALAAFAFALVVVLIQNLFNK